MYTLIPEWLSGPLDSYIFHLFNNIKTLNILLYCKINAAYDIKKTAEQPVVGLSSAVCTQYSEKCGIRELPEGAAIHKKEVQVLTCTKGF